MDYKESINHRRSIEKKVFASEKLTKEEKLWLETNPLFNVKYDFPCYKRDVLQVPKKLETVVTITPIKYNDKTKVYHPVISVIGKGAIKVEGQLVNYDGKKVDYKETKGLIPLFDEKNSVTVKIFSESGLINIAYQCEIYDEQMKYYVRESSSGAKLLYGMKRQDISENKFVYHCKSPNTLNDPFDAFVFSIEVIS